jgi:rubrerythrin
MGLDDKLIRLLGHWAKHNHEHAHTYRDWAEQARKAGRDEIAALLGTIAEQTLRIAGQLEQGLKTMEKV